MNRKNQRRVGENYQMENDEDDKSIQYLKIGIKMNLRRLNI